MTIIRNVAKKSGGWLVKAGQILSEFGSRSNTDTNSSNPGSTEWFLNKTYRSLNEARLAHLASLGLLLEGKTVLEVGAGMGLLTKFFEDRHCKVLSTDGRRENVEAIRRSFPNRDVQVFNLFDFDAYNSLGSFDIVFCYGTLYHTPEPDEILGALSKVCREMILLETCVTPGGHSDVHLTREGDTIDQAINNIGCRPTRPWLYQKLKTYYGHSYITKTQPRHNDFDLDWKIPLKKLNHRAIFIGSKFPIQNPLLVESVPLIQEHH